MKLIAWEDRPRNDLLCIERDAKQLFTRPLVHGGSWKWTWENQFQQDDREADPEWKLNNTSRKVVDATSSEGCPVRAPGPSVSK